MTKKTMDDYIREAAEEEANNAPKADEEMMEAKPDDEEKPEEWAPTWLDLFKSCTFVLEYLFNTH